MEVCGEVLVAVFLLTVVISFFLGRASMSQMVRMPAPHPSLTVANLSFQVNNCPVWQLSPFYLSCWSLAVGCADRHHGGTVAILLAFSDFHYLLTTPIPDELYKSKVAISTVILSLIG